MWTRTPSFALVASAAGKATRAYRGLAASRIAFTKHVRKIAPEQRLDTTHIYAH